MTITRHSLWVLSFATASMCFTSGAALAATPIANDGSVAVVMDTAASFKAPVTSSVPDEPVANLPVVITQTPSHGTATGSWTNITYTPNAGYTGTDTFSWKVSNGTDVESNEATCSVLVREAGDNAGMMVLLVVNSLILPEIRSEIERLQSDLENEGHTTLVREWDPALRGRSEDLWNLLVEEYRTPGRITAGAILIGSLPSARNTNSNQTTDLVYWNMSEFGPAYRRDIWVSRMWALTGGGADWFEGGEVALLKRVLQANHDYRTGAHVLPNGVHYIMHAYPNSESTYYPRDGGNALDIWDSVTKSHPLEAWTLGGSLLDETMLGSATNQMLLTRGGGNVLSIGASATTYTGGFTILQDYGSDVQFRQSPGCGIPPFQSPDARLNSEPLRNSTTTSPSTG